MPEDIWPFDIAHALYDKVIEWAKEKEADIAVCSPIPIHAKMIERYCESRKLLAHNLGNCSNINTEGTSKPKVAMALQLSDKVHFKLPTKAIS